MKSKGKQRDVKVADEGGANFDRLAKIQGISQDIGKLDSVRFEQGADADQDKTTESNRLPDETSNRPYLMSGGNPDI
jgi:hypothetical protein